jgi:hydroxymethylbilane synthase
MSARALRIGTRASELALWQARHVEALLRGQSGAPPVELVRITTAGDRAGEVPLWKLGGRAFFTREIDNALLEGTVDIAVHSLKDLPTQLEAGVTLAAMLARADARDALVSRDGRPFAQLPRGARVGTSSLRRRAFVARLRPDVLLAELRGNVPTRLQRLRQGDYDAIILAAAGLERLGLTSQITEYLDAADFPPAVSQGVIGVCTRADDSDALRWLVPLDDRDASVCALDGSRTLSARGSTSGPIDAALPAALAAAVQLGEHVAQDLLAQGAAALMAQERGALAVEAP